MNLMSPFNVLEDYVVHVVTSAPDGLAGAIRHVFPTKDGTGVQTPVGYFMAFIGEPSEMRPIHWEVRVFFRADIRYDLARKRCERGASNRRDSDIAYHPDLPRNLGTALIDRGFCSEPIALSISLYQNADFVEFGRTWADDY